MRNSVIVNRVMSEVEGVDNMNISHVEAQTLIKMGVLYHSHADYEVHRTDDTTITVYSYRKA